MKAIVSISILALVLVGCQSSDKSALYPKSEVLPIEPSKTFEMPTPKDGDDVAILDTDAGKIVVGFMKDKAPKTVENFMKLSKEGFYNGVKFHRTVPGFMIQFGDPNTKNKPKEQWGSGGPGYNINDEFNDTPHVRGILSMANSGGANTAGSQFFIMVAENRGLDGRYTAFGYVISGMDVVDKIVSAKAEKLPGSIDDVPSTPVNAVAAKSVTLTKWPIK